MPVTHSFVSAIPDGTNTSLVRPSDWNAQHVIDVDLTSEVSGALPIANGGTGQTTANNALNALLPSQSGNSGKFLSTDGTDTSWTALSDIPVTKSTFTGQTSITITHNLGFETIFQVFVASDKIEPYTQTQTTNAISITFSSAQTGYVIYVSSAAYSSASNSVNSISTTYTVQATDDTIICTGSTDYTVTLLDSANVPVGKIFNIKHIGSGTITLATTSSQTIDDETSMIINAGTSGAYPNMQVQRYGDNWIIL